MLALLVAGCAAPAVPGPGSAPGGPFELDADASGCVESIALFLLPLDHLQRFLPAGFTAADAQGLLGTPAPAGQGAMFLSGYRCAHMALAAGPAGLAEGGIYVETPTLEPARAFEPGHDFYVPAYHTTAPSMATRLAPAQLAGDPATVEVTHETGLTPLVTGALEATDAEGLLFAYAYEAPVRGAMSGYVRLWQQTPGGPSLFELLMPENPIAQGQIVSCEIRAGSPWAEMADRTSCARGDALALLILDQGWEGTFRHMTDAVVVA